MNIRYGILLLFFAAVMSSCSVLKNEERERHVREFLISFQTTLSRNDDVILQLASPQAQDLLKSILRVLRNKQTEGILCEPSYGAAIIIFTEQSVRVELPIIFRSHNRANAFQGNCILTLYLKAAKERYTITKIDADDFYFTFAKLRREMEWDVDRERLITEEEKFYRSV